MNELTTWWGKFEVEDRGYWRVGPFEMVIARAAREWSVEFARGPDTLERNVAVEVPGSRDLPEKSERVRYATAAKENVVLVSPILAPRAVVVRPANTIIIPPRERAELFVSTPLWISLRFREQSDAVFETSLARPSDTWFGANTREGEMCFASRSRARSELDPRERLSHRANSPLQIHNRAVTRLVIDRVRIPTTNLSLFTDKAGRFWTENVTLLREEDGDMAGIRVGSGAPGEADGAQLVARARVKPEKGLSIRSFGSFMR